MNANVCCDENVTPPLHTSIAEHLLGWRDSPVTSDGRRCVELRQTQRGIEREEGKSMLLFFLLYSANARSHFERPPSLPTYQNSKRRQPLTPHHRNIFSKTAHPHITPTPTTKKQRDTCNQEGPSILQTKRPLEKKRRCGGRVFLLVPDLHLALLQHHVQAHQRVVVPLRVVLRHEGCSGKFRDGEG